jgi:hypothetical protein
MLSTSRKPIDNMSSQSKRGPKCFGFPNGHKTTGVFGKVRYYQPPVPEDEASAESRMARFNKQFKQFKRRKA